MSFSHMNSAVIFVLVLCFCAKQVISITNIRNGYACEGGNLKIKCDEGEVISIVYGNYGRFTRDLCHHAQMRNIQCKSPNSLSIIKQRCNNKRSCEIPSTNGIFGDPCVNTYKYTEVNYECVKVSRKEHACEGDHLKIKCSPGEVISIIDGNYGRFTRDLCTHAQMSDIHCESSNSLNIIKQWCNDKISCDIPSSNAIFGDPCVNTYKYTEVIYECVKNYQTEYACEGQNLKIKCGKGEAISIIDGNYGRFTRDLCPHAQMSNIQCKSPNSLDILKQGCNNKISCEIPSSNGIFGDPCVHTYKYTEVNYECVKDNRQEYACEGQHLKINCGKGEVILIIDGNYGRLTRDLCPHAQISNIQCKAPKSLDIIKERCNKKPSCDIPSSNGIFGDPCVNTYKYTEVNYQCVKGTYE